MCPDVTGTTYMGDFWLSNQPEHRVAGELRLDGENGARLSLSGSSKNVSQLAGMSRDHTFFGRLGRQPVTVSGARMVQGSRMGEVWSAESVLRGAHDAEPASALYDCARFEVSDIGHWLTESSELRVEEAGDRPKLSLIYEPLPMPSAATAFGEVKLAQNFRRTGDGVISLGIEQTWEIEMRFTPAQPLWKILDQCEHVRRLVTFGLGTRVTPRQLTLITAHSAPPGCQPRRPIHQTRIALCFPTGQPLIRRLPRHPSRFRSCRHRPAPHPDPIHQQLPPERRQPGSTMRHEGLLSES